MNEIRASHLVERAAMRLRGGFGLLDPASEAASPAPSGPRPPSPREDGFSDHGGLPPAAVLPDYGLSGPEAPARTVPPAGPPPAPSAEASAAGASPGAASSAPVLLDIATLERVGVCQVTGRRTRIAEEFSVAAGAVLRGMRAVQAAGASALPAGAFANLLLVTSAKPGEGKTFSAINLAASVARNGLSRAVLVDIDPKPGSISVQLGLEGRPGLFDLAADPALRPDGLLVSTPFRDLSVLPLGSREGVVSGHGLTRRMATAIERIARRFAGQMVVLDAPPCLATSEPSALAPMVGLIALVIEAERTQREDLETTLDLVKTCPNVMLLLNKMRDRRGHAFGDYDYYGS